MNNYAWHGKPVKTQFGFCTVFTNKGKPLWWYNYECSERLADGMSIVPAIKVTVESGYSFCLGNHFGIAHHQLINGGWPGYAQFGLPIDGFEESKKAEYNLRQFDLIGYEEHEARRRKWQFDNFPVEFEKSERLRQIIQRGV